MEQVSLVAEGGMDAHLVECHKKGESMSPDTTEVASTQEVETMDVEPLEETCGE